MRAHEIDYKIQGHDLQYVEIELDRGETVIAEAGAMLYMEDGISFETKMGDGSEPNQGLFGKLLSAGSRLLAGELLFMTHFTIMLLQKNMLLLLRHIRELLFRLIYRIMAVDLSCRKTLFYAPLLAQRFLSHLIKKLVPDFLVAKVLFSNA